MDNVTHFTIVTATVAVAVFCMVSLLIRAVKTPAYFPLAFLFVMLCSASGGALVEAFAPSNLKVFYRFTFPAYLSMGPLLWLYVKGLTAESPWKFKRKDIWHLVPFLLGLILVVLDLTVLDVSMLKGKTEARPVGSGPVLKTYVVVISSLWMLATVLWFTLPFFYIAKILRRLSHYRKKLKIYFASNEERELGWVNGYLVIFAAIWAAVLIAIINENVSGSKSMPEIVGACAFLILVVSLGLLGLSQRPGFEGRYLVDEAKAPVPDESTSEDSEKYQRSALSPGQSKRIAEKIAAAMERDALYLDPSLSLHKLAKHILVSPNYISQTLNETIGECFFDYVNRWRIEAAKPRVKLGEETVLAIAYDVGFNARSSFYKAFKRVTGRTPSEYRDQKGASAQMG